MKCPLCESSDLRLWSEDKLRSYHYCNRCTLIFVPRYQLILETEEFERYKEHESDEGYRSYLGAIVTGALPFLPKGSRGLDFGCGQTKLLGEIFLEGGLEVESFDLFFHPLDLAGKKYDFIILSEVIEHLREPLIELQRIRELLAEGGQLFVKTRIYPTRQEEFSSWFYKRDVTHIQFFSEGSFKKLADLLNLQGPETTSCRDLVRFTSK